MVGLLALSLVVRACNHLHKKHISAMNTPQPPPTLGLQSDHLKLQEKEIIASCSAETE